MFWFVEFRAVDGRVTRSLGYFADLTAAQRPGRTGRPARSPRSSTCASGSASRAVKDRRLIPVA
jgi:hypothetical protein